MTFFEEFSSRLRKKKSPLIATLLLLMVLLGGLVHFKEKHDVRIWFRETDPNIKLLDEFEKHFGNDESLVIVVNSPSGIFDQESLALLQDLTEKTWLIPQIIRVDSLTNFRLTFAEEDEINVRPLVSEEPEDWTLANLEEWEETAKDHRILTGFLIDKTASDAFIHAQIVNTLDQTPDYRLIMEQTQKMLDELPNKGDHKFFISGDPAINDAFNIVSKQDMAKVIPGLIIVCSLLLLYLFRSPSGVIAPILLVVSTTVGAFGFMSWVGIEFNSILSVIPGIMISVGIADSIHIMTSYYIFYQSGFSKEEAIDKSIDKNFFPTLITSISTMIGFFSLTKTELLPIRNMAIVAGFGTGFAWLLTIFVLGRLLKKLPALKRRKNLDLGNKDGSPSAFSSKFIDWIDSKKKIIVSFSIVGAVSFVYLGLQNTVNSDAYSYFTDEVPLSVANNHVLDSVGGIMGPDLFLDAGKEEGIKDPTFLFKVEELADWIESLPRVNQTVSLLKNLRETNMALNGGLQKYYKIPPSQQEVATGLFLYSMGLPQGADLNNLMTLKGDALRLNVLWDIQDSKTALEFYDEINAKMEELEIKGHITGKYPLYQRMIGYVVTTFFTSIGIAFLLVSILMIYIFKSFKLGMFSMIPNVVPLFFGAGLMTLLDKPLNVGTSLVTSVCLGIAVDDTIHFLTTYHKYLKQGHTPKESLARVFTYTMPALVTTTILLSAGFGLFVVGDFTPNIDFGILTASVLTMALLTDIFLLPALILLKNK